MSHPMKRYGPIAACVAGIAVIALLLPLYNWAQSQGVRLTRAQAAAVADKAGRTVGIPVDKAWSILTWQTSSLLNKEVRKDPARRRLTAADPVFGPRLGASARPTVLRTRTDWVFRYRVPSAFPAGKVAAYLNVHFSGDRFLGWSLTEEYADGSQYEGDDGSEFAAILFRFALVYAVLIFLL